MVDFAISLVLVPDAVRWAEADRGRRRRSSWLLVPLRVVAISLPPSQGGHRRRAAAALVPDGGIMRLRVDTNHINFFTERPPAVARPR